MPEQTPQHIKELKAYLVGGAVRDKLLGLPVHDRDWVVVGASPATMEALRFKPVGRDFPVFLHPENREEYALARTERKTGPGYKGFAFNTSTDVTLEQDLERRDLTINAIAETKAGAIIDPFHGVDDLRNEVLRHVSPAFVEDPVRILRIARFRARFDFTVAAETMTLMQEMVSNGEVDTLVAERVWNEFRLALVSAKPELFIDTLRQCGALARVFPEIDALFGVPQPAAYHPEIDSGVHTLMVLHQAAALTDDPLVRFAALVHDLGKALSPPDQLPRHHRHEILGLQPITALCQRLNVPNEYRNLATVVCKLHLQAHRALELKPATLLKMLETMDAFRRPQRLAQFLLACEADARGRKGMEDRPYPQADRVRRAHAAALSVDAAAIAKQHQDGGRIAAELRQQRCDAIARMM